MRRPPSEKGARDPRLLLALKGGIYICDECVAECGRLITAHMKKKEKQAVNREILQALEGVLTKSWYTAATRRQRTID